MSYFHNKSGMNEEMKVRIGPQPSPGRYVKKPAITKEQYEKNRARSAELFKEWDSRKARLKALKKAKK